MVIGFIAMALIVTGALIGLALYTKWQDALVAQERQSANLARVLQEQTLRVLAPHRPSHAAHARCCGQRQLPALRLHAAGQ